MDSKPLKIALFGNVYQTQKNRYVEAIVRMLHKLEAEISVEAAFAEFLTSRLGLSKNYLHPALEAGLIEMANPLTPTDRNQRYRKVSQ